MLDDLWLLSLHDMQMVGRYTLCHDFKDRLIVRTHDSDRSLYERNRGTSQRQNPSLVGRTEGRQLTADLEQGLQHGPMTRVESCEELQHRWPEYWPPSPDYLGQAVVIG